MSQATPSMRDFAKLLITDETRQNKSFETKHPAAFHVCEKLRPQLATLMGNAGFRALLARALALASKEVAWLHGVTVNADGSLEGLEELHGQLDPQEFYEGKVVLLARLLGLLEVFIGANLTLRLVREAWPNVPLGNLDSDNGGKNEKTK
jgi:hypothetical protein